MLTQQMKLKYIAITILLAAIALVSGIYIGFRGSLVEGQTAEAAGVPKDLKDVDMSQFWDVWRMLEKRHPDGLSISSEEKVWGAIEGLVDSVGDPYTVFLPPEENEALNIDLKGKFSGVGMEVGMREEGITVIAPLKDSPAEKAGILPGDILIKIDEKLASDLDVDQAVALIRGPEGTDVSITIFRKGESAPREIVIKRAVIKIPVLETELLAKDKVFVIRLFSFGEDSAKEFEKALKEFSASGSEKLILDLRNNPGGFLSAAVDISSWFLPAGETVVVEESLDPTENRTYKSLGHPLPGNYKMVVLVNGGSASASEILAGALQEHGKAKLVGTQTYGKGSVQELVDMKKNTSLKITIAKWLTPNGVSISKQGLTPDVKVELDLVKLEKEGIDTQEQKAIQILNAK